MPVIKIPVVHKFGIISHTQRLELQKRLLRQNYEKEKAASKVNRAHNPLEVCEEFVRKYNASKLDEKERFFAEADRLVTHCKRRVGIATQGEGERVDLPMAWSELAILAQCKGKLQEDCFEILCRSLNHAPLHEENVPTLFFLAESVLYWLRTDSSKNSNLRTSEILLLKLGFLVFVRLYFHHLINNLDELDEFKTRLLTYLHGVKELESLYNSYPGVWLSLRFIARIGEKITASTVPTAEDELEQPKPQVFLRPIIFQALQVWRFRDKAVGLKKALLDIIICGKDLSQEDWVDSLFAISIFGDAAKSNSTVCRTLQDVSRGVTVPVDDLEMPKTSEFKSSLISPKKHTAGNACDQNKETRGENFQKIMNGMMADLDSALGKTPRSTSHEEESIVQTSEQPTKEGNVDIQAETAAPGTSRSRQTPTSRLSHRSHVSNPNTPRSDADGTISAGISSWSSEVAYQYSQIMTDICLHGASAPIQKMALLGKWLGADVTTFRAGAPNFCIESCGLVDLLEYRNPEMLAKEIENSDTAKEDWSWRIRYGALSGLLHMTHALKEETLKDGMRSAAWSLILAIENSPASEDRVLEAIRVGQVEFPYFNKPLGNSTPLNIWSRISRSLTEYFIIPSLPLPRSPSSLARRSPSVQPETRQSVRQTPKMKLSPPPLPTKSPSNSPRRACPNRTTLKEHLTVPTNTDNLSSNIHTRYNLNMSRIVEDQWRKQRLKEHEQEEKIRLRELKIQQEEEENRLLEIAKSRREKLQGKPTQNLSPYEIPCNR